MKVGDIVHHKTNTEVGMVVTLLPKEEEALFEDGVTCRWWEPTLHKFVEEVFDPKELLFDGEQQQKGNTYIPKGDEADDGGTSDVSKDRREEV